jgi:uncharacterized membrane protein
MHWLRGCFYGLIAIAVLQTLYYYPRMPDIVASHFDGLGAPNGWSSRVGFFGTYLAILLMLVVIFEVVPRLSESWSGFWRNLPNRDYWLAPERIDRTRAFLRRQMMLMGNLHLLLAIFAIQLAIQANFAPEPRMHSSIVWVLGIYFLALAAWLIFFFLHFRKPH